MTTGEKIKQTLKLDYDNIFITKGILSGGRPVYFIFFNSKFPNASIQYNKVLAHQKFDFYRGDKLEQGVKQRMTYFPFEKLENFNRSITNAYFIVYDLADYMRSPRYDWYTETINAYDDIISNDTRLVEKCLVGKGRLEEITLEQLKVVDAYTSELTKKYKDIRDKVQGKANTNSKFLDTLYKPETGSFSFVFLVESTEETDKEKISHDHKKELKKVYNFETGKVENNPSGLYQLELQIENIVPNSFYSGEPWIYVYDGEKLDANLMLDLLYSADIKLSSNDMSFYYQGFAYRLDKIGASINHVNIPDTLWGKKHGQALLTKHWSSILDKNYLGFVANQFVASMFKHLKKLGYLDPATNIITAHPEN